MSQQQVVVESRIRSYPVAYEHHIYIDETLYGPSEWRAEQDLIRTASPADTIHFHINSGGGSLHTATAILKAMAESPARMVGHIEGLCASAVTLIFLECDDFVVSDDAEMMIHTSSSAAFGKETDMFQYSQHYNSNNKKLMHKYYKGYLQPEEISSVIDGKDFWMDAEEIMARLDARKNGETEQALEKLTRDELKEIADQTGIKYTGKTSTDKLRTLVKEKIGNEEP